MSFRGMIVSAVMARGAVSRLIVGHSPISKLDVEFVAQMQSWHRFIVVSEFVGTAIVPEGPAGKVAVAAKPFMLLKQES